MSDRKQVVLTTVDREAPPASKTACRFFSACSLCSSMVSPTMAPVPGSRGIWPDVNTSLPLTMPWL